MISLKQLPKKVIDLLTERLKDEQQAFYFYVAASAWCRLNGYENTAKYMHVESSGEERHFKRLSTYLTDWNTPVEFPPISTPVKTFASLADLFEQQYQMEYALLEKYNADCQEIYSVSHNAYLFLQDYVRMQDESVKEIGCYITKLNGYLKTDPGLMIFDKEVFGDMYGGMYL